MRVFIIDDHPTVREGLKYILAYQQEASVVGEAASAREGLKALETLACDVVLVDLNLPDLDGARCVEKLREMRADLPVIILSMHTDDSVVLEALRAGARGYVVKSAPVGDLLAALKEVVAGGSYVHPRVAGALLTGIRTPLAPRHDERLSVREREVLKLVVDGEGNAVIADRLCVSVSTVKSVVRSLFNKFGVSERTQLAVHALKGGLG